MKHKRFPNMFSSAIEEMDFVVDGEPIPKARPRTNYNTKVTYTPSKTTNNEKIVAMAAQKAMDEQGFHKAIGEIAVSLRIIFYHEIPKSKTKWWKLAAAYGLIPCVSKKRGDVDNKVKLVMDGMNGIVYDDDSQVFQVFAYSKYSYNPRTEIKVSVHYVNVGELKSEVEFIKEIEDAQMQTRETDL